MLGGNPQPTFVQMSASGLHHQKRVATTNEARLKRLEREAIKIKEYQGLVDGAYQKVQCLNHSAGIEIIQRNHYN
jgi:hypothetical protein